MIKQKIYLLTFCLLTISAVVQAQMINKKGGLCFRIDDDQDPIKLKSIDSVFQKNGVHFVYSPNSQRANFTQPASFWPTVKLLQDHGHEIADHSPNHYPHFFEVNGADTLRFKNRAGVDHINFVNEYPVLGTRICLKYSILNAGGAGDEGLVDIQGNLLISKNNGEFSNNKIYGGRYTSQFYFPSLNLLCSYIPNLYNLNSNDPDTIELLSFWNEKITIGNYSNIAYKKLNNYDISVDPEGFKVMQQFSLDIFKKNGINAPTVWIQPGGPHPYLSKSFIADICGHDYGFKSAATYPGAIKGFNEIDNEHEKHFHMQWGDMYEETQDLTTMKGIIADRQARHLITMGLNHLSFFGGFPYQTLLSNLDSLLQWCNAKQIPVKTYSEWGAVLYDSIAKPSENVFPLLTTDLDGDNMPDGIQILPAELDKTQGAGITPTTSIKITQTKQIFGINRLSGVERDKNILKFYAKGTPGSNNLVSMYFDYPEVSKFQQFSIKCTTSTFTETIFECEIPEGVSYINLYGYANIDVGDIAVSGLELRGIAKPRFRTTTFKRSNNKTFGDINMRNYIADEVYDVANLTLSVLNAGNFNATITGNQFLKLEHKQNPFWIGKDSVQLIVSNPANLADTAWFYFQSNETSICKMEKVQLVYPFKSSTESTITWSAIPADTSLTTNISNPTVQPLAGTTYTATVVDKNSVSKNYVITINVKPSVMYTNANINKYFLTTDNQLDIDINLPYYSTAFISNMPKRNSQLANGTLTVQKGNNLGVDTTTIIIYNKSCDIITQYVITSTDASGIIESKLPQVFIYPNPFHNYLTIENLPYSKNGFEVSIYNMVGKEMHKQHIAPNQNTVNTNWLPTGVYILKLNNAEGLQRSFKVLKN
ncbi:MAG: T9SS type A sorting domain-containing protein [Bacteroidota bacterium]